MVVAQQTDVAVRDAPGELPQGAIVGLGVAPGGSRGDARRGGGAAPLPVDALPGGKRIADGQIGTESGEGVGPAAGREVERALLAPQLGRRRGGAAQQQQLEVSHHGEDEQDEAGSGGQAGRRTPRRLGRGGHGRVLAGGGGYGTPGRARAGAWRALQPAEREGYQDRRRQISRQGEQHHEGADPQRHPAVPERQRERRQRRQRERPPRPGAAAAAGDGAAAAADHAQQAGRQHQGARKANQVQHEVRHDPGLPPRRRRRRTAAGGVTSPSGRWREAASCARSASRAACRAPTGRAGAGCPWRAASRTAGARPRGAPTLPGRS